MKKKSWVAALGLVALLGGCASAPLPQGHGSQSEGIKKLMRQLNADLLDNYNSELQKDEIRIRYAHRLASDLVAAASGLERKFDLEAQEGKISPLQKSKYLAYAGELREHARRLDTIAQRYETEKLSGAFGSLEKTCAACHADVKAKP